MRSGIWSCGIFDGEKVNNMIPDYMSVVQKFGTFLLLVLSVGSCSPVFATTYNDFMLHSSTDEKPAQIKTEEEAPVLVTYEVGDTSSFHTGPEKSAFPEDSSEWDDSDDEYSGR